MNAKTTFFRRLTSNYRKLLCGLSALACFNLGSPAVADSLTLPDVLIGVTQGFLEFTVEDYLATSQTPGRYEIQVNQLDPRMHMPACDKELTATLESPAQPLGRVTVKVRCEGASPWTVFVPAQVKLFREVVTTTRPLKRAGIVEPDDVALRERDISLISQGYLTSVDQAIGQKLVRPMVADQLITLVHLEQAEVVRKGDQVVISARSGTLNVRMPGEALSNGGMSEQIRVKNLNSQRIIKARVTAPGQVEVAM
ncbi:flagella basal body P-ring formation protein FlgA [Pseudomonas chlororaphis]|jgi:flagellar basal body P-ring formation protein FlgA|uniref:Flagella basal body P-ring formation protein FlgA n=1 Tax=Pseudomonas morbosilactucae TaxID=2938197 RepID=A0A9X1YU04_9PSED|nr:flagellar basal body P-ring formation chaperone FlgA [Pseudomonas morbosilactucae]MCK9797576.1 flagellar basal body P-ring formation protein FlgA [Pseudomonas morbosilactucae]MCK9814126.1 flagellar basal body P-ring formation protein FlgA [Pseudomonas morbosilactucae]ROL72192.1 flagella basal body P-ring formation protein FlgA [Pseudomonas chlororaphis]WEK08692.1 MAG: flagellar basal body P-ring formation chaperone FlgA [Pseudomonas sp.]